jgi:acetyl esterase
MIYYISDGNANRRRPEPLAPPARLYILRWDGHPAANTGIAMSETPAPFVTPATAAILARARAAPPVDYVSMTMQAARALFDRNNAYWNSVPVDLPEVTELDLPGPAGTMRARLYRPRLGGTLPVLLYVHGGGWTFGNVGSHDRCMRLLARESGAAVLGFDYRLAPEHPFPAAMDDSVAALDWIRRLGTAHGLDPARIAIGGDSAGANIALATLVAQRDACAPALVGAVLFYGCYAPLHETESHRRFGGGDYVLSTARMRWYWRNYLGDLPEDTTALAVPLRADLRGLPRLFLNAAGLDPLLDDTILLAGRLAHAGTPYELDLIPGAIHGCMQQTSEEPGAAASLSRAAAYLADAFARGVASAP